MPTEAEWEFAAKGGNKSEGYIYSGSNNVDFVGWYHKNSGDKLHQVGEKGKNELNIYDMTGNAEEWCWDWCETNSSESVTDPYGAISGDYRVMRGGSSGSGYINNYNLCVTYRTSASPALMNKTYGGFRLVRSATKKK